MLDKDKIPAHIAIIMDGNGRWAKEKGLPRTVGHREGIKRVREIVNAAADFGVRAVTLFAFSTENWSRPKSEVQALMRFLDTFLEKEVRDMHKNNIRFRVIGQDEPLPKKALAKLRACQELTQGNTRMDAIFALNYGSRQEIVDAAKRFAQVVQKGEATLAGLNPDNFGEYLYTAGIPDADLLIRTSGEMRISNFLLWQLSYAELYFCEKYWPDFKRQDLLEAIEEYQRRERRFGGVDVRKKNR